MATVVLLGTLDTKGNEYAYLRDKVQAAGCEVILIDAGVKGTPLAPPDISREEVARAAGADVAQLAAIGDRGASIETMARGATAIVSGLFAQGRLHGVLGLGGSGGSALITQAMRALPVGVPKLMVSTLASGDTRPYVGAVDIAMMYSVVDIAGINRLSERILSNAAAAISGMAQSYATFQPAAATKPLIGATMFGVTTPCVTEARQYLEARGYEVLVFHATGTGGQSMEALVNGGFLAGVLDITTTELADELVGGVLSAGPHRLEAAGKQALPQVVSLGALDMVNFGPIDTVPEKFRTRTLYKHNPTVTLMRTTPQECAELGHIIARKLNQARGPVALFIPLRGVSLIDTEGQPFYDPVADQALIDALKADLHDTVEVHELDMEINDPRFAQAMASRLDELIRQHVSTTATGGTQ
ncbi:MAG: Tm-1-like ATP-binding domain-containing protein [Ktedonobacteraceae bacterium]|nr:Tm-1-like ATP-binding domain-containing protein [Ktedonobacteraceae bacterium]